VNPKGSNQYRSFSVGTRYALPIDACSDEVPERRRTGRRDRQDVSGGHGGGEENAKVESLLGAGIVGAVHRIVARTPTVDRCNDVGHRELLGDVEARRPRVVDALGRVRRIVVCQPVVAIKGFEVECQIIDEKALGLP